MQISVCLCISTILHVCVTFSSCAIFCNKYFDIWFCVITLYTMNYMCQWNVSALLQVIAWRLFNPVLMSDQWDTYEQTPVKYNQNMYFSLQHVFRNVFRVSQCVNKPKSKQ